MELRVCPEIDYTSVDQLLKGYPLCFERSADLVQRIGDHENCNKKNCVLYQKNLHLHSFLGL